MRFGTMDIQLTRLGEKDKGAHHELAHSAYRSEQGGPLPEAFKRHLTDKSSEIGK
jgi:hypothetical protein